MSKSLQFAILFSRNARSLSELSYFHRVDDLSRRYQAASDYLAERFMRLGEEECVLAVEDAASPDSEIPW